jgi:ornithine cyclodeaminase/alanine dehydrogenase-like protein (mu-crystallin family)
VFKIIEDDEARLLLDRAEAIGIVEAAYRMAASGKADVSQPSALLMRGQAGSDTHFKVKGAVLDELNVAGFRLVADGALTSPGGSAYLYVADAGTARPLGLISESWLHRIRTATTGLVTCRALWPAGAKTLALVGTGRIAEEFIRSCHLVLPDVNIALASRSAARAHAKAEEWRHLTPNPLSSATIPDALAQAEVVVTLSDAAEILFKASDLQPRALLCAMGGRYEFDSDVLHAAHTFIVDEMDFVCTFGSATHWIATNQLTRADLERRLDATIGELLVGAKSNGKGRLTLAIIQGMAICDLALAKTVLDRARGTVPSRRANA